MKTLAEREAYWLKWPNGDAGDAIDWAVDKEWEGQEAGFLDDWRSGGEGFLARHPEYAEWLKTQRSNARRVAMSEESEKMGGTRPSMRFFDASHLPDHLKIVSEKFQDLAVELADELPNGPEKDMALRKLLEAKDCAVRAVL